MINKNLKIYREKAGYTQTEVAKFLCISPQSVSKWESGESLPSTEYLPKLTDLFECTIDDLFRKEKAEKKCKPIPDISADDIKKFFSMIKKHDEGSISAEQLKKYFSIKKDTVEYILNVLEYLKNEMEFSMPDFQENFNIGFAKAAYTCDGLTEIGVIGSSRKTIKKELKSLLLLLN